MSARIVKRLAGAAAIVALLAHLYDPPWAGNVSSGFRRWEGDPPGTRFRWTGAHASFFVPSTAATLTLPMRAVFPGPDGGPTKVDIRVDDRWLATIELPDPAAWVDATLPLGRGRTRRRFRRVDLRVNRVLPPYTLGVMTGPAVLH